MSTPPPPPPPADVPPTTLPDVPDVAASAEVPSWLKVGGIGVMVLGVLVSLYFFAFHLGAAVLSYRTYGSFLWAILDFFFPYFYYPYYAFVAGVPEPATGPAMMGGAAKRVAKGLMSRKRGFRRV